MHPDRERWNEKYRKGAADTPSVALLMYQGRLARGRALDVAGGSGENAALLALAGWQVTLADLSDEAVRRARNRAHELKASVRIVQADALRLPFRGPFETIVVTKFLDRSAAGPLTDLLAPGGTLLAETLMTGLPEPYRIGSGEFARLFTGLEPILDTDDGKKAIFIGKKKP